MGFPLAVGYWILDISIAVGYCIGWINLQFQQYVCPPTATIQERGFICFRYVALFHVRDLSWGNTHCYWFSGLYFWKVFGLTVKVDFKTWLHFSSNWPMTPSTASGFNSTLAVDVGCGCLDIRHCTGRAFSRVFLHSRMACHLFSLLFKVFFKRVFAILMADSALPLDWLL